MIFNLMKPIPIAEPTEQWETLIDTELDFTGNKYGIYADTHLDDNLLKIQVGDIIRISDSKNSWVVTAYDDPSNTKTYETVCFGNSDIQGNIVGKWGIDTDCDYGGMSSTDGILLGYFYAREAKKERIKIERWVGGSPTMYSYNGAVLPKLPTWDKESYPYAGILMNKERNYYKLAVFSEINYRMGKVDLEETWLISPPYGFLESDLRDTEWEELKLRLAQVIVAGFGWTNFDLLGADGTVCLKATEPVPVYE